MKLSELHLKTLREAPKDEVSQSTILLLRARFIEKLGAGVYNYLPFGLRTLNKISNIIREEMEKIGAFEVLMASLHPRQKWEITQRWGSFDALFKVQSRSEQEFALGPTHEKKITPLAANFISSYKDLPLYLFQIQTKFRDEPRPKSGILRGREFLMKDLYSFHASAEDLAVFYEKMKKVYVRIFKRLGLRVLITEGSGGTFSAGYSHEFQTPVTSGEDTVLVCPQCSFARNQEVAVKIVNCPRCGAPLEEIKCAEVGNIFQLGHKYSQPFDLVFIDKDGEKKWVEMGCYGIGVSRLLGVIGEVYHDEFGFTWPLAVAPFKYQLITLTSGNPSINKKIKKTAEDLYRALLKNNEEVLYDDRDISAGEKFKDADLIGAPWRLVVSEKALNQGALELKKRNKKTSQLIKLKKFVKILSSKKDNG